MPHSDASHPSYTAPMTGSPSLQDLPVLAHYLGPAAIDPPPQPLPMGGVRARLGFPSPAEDFEDDGLDLNGYLVRNPAATFFYRAQGWSMVQAGICDGDVLIVDRSATPQDGDIVIASWDGETPVCKVLSLNEAELQLLSCNPEVPPIVLAQGTDVEVFAVVGVVRQVRRMHSRMGRSN